MKWRMRIIRFRKPDCFNEADPKMAECARWWHSRGFNVIPIVPDVLKKPISGIEWNRWEHERQTLEELNVMLAGLAVEEIRFNLAVILGTYGEVTHAVVDLDKDDYVPKFFEHFKQLSKDSTLITKPSKGAHVFVTLTQPCSTHHLEGKGVKIDLQCEGAYVIVPPSLHATARNKDGSRLRYAFISNQVDEIYQYEGDLWLDLVDFIRAYIDKNFVPKTNVVSVDELLKPRAEHEGRNVAGIQFACLLFETLKDDPDAENKVWAKFQEWNANHIEPMSEQELRTIFESANTHRYLFKFDRALTREELEVKQPLTPEMEAFLKAPDLDARLIKIINHKIVGEDNLCLLIYFNSCSSSITKSPFGVIIVSLPGLGKSYVEQNMMDFFPPERIEQPTSISEQVLNYLGKNYGGLIVRIDELFGMEEGMQDLRVWMTNGRLERWVTDPDTHKALKMIVDGCPAFNTTTIEKLEPQYGSRNWICYANPTVKQTRDIHTFQDVNDEAPQGLLSEKALQDIKFIQDVSRWVMQNSKPVVIPFRYMFPYKTGRMRRERPKFANLIKSIAQVYQLQRETFTHKGVKHIIASEEDFKLAKKITAQFLESTLFTLDEMELSILGWVREKKRNEQFKVKDVATALALPYSTTLHRLHELAKNGYINEITEPFGQRAIAFELSELGLIENLIKIEIYDHGHTLVELYRKLPDSEPELATLLTKRRREGPYRDTDADDDAKPAGNKVVDKSSDSKKEANSQKRLEGD